MFRRSSAQEAKNIVWKGSCRGQLRWLWNGGLPGGESALQM